MLALRPAAFADTHAPEPKLRREKFGYVDRKKCRHENIDRDRQQEADRRCQERIVRQRERCAEHDGTRGGADDGRLPSEGVRGDRPHGGSDRTSHGHQERESGAAGDRLALSDEERRQPGDEAVDEGIDHHQRYAAHDKSRQERLAEKTACRQRQDGPGHRIERRQRALQRSLALEISNQRIRLRFAPDRCQPAGGLRQNSCAGTRRSERQRHPARTSPATPNAGTSSHASSAETGRPAVTRVQIIPDHRPLTLAGKNSVMMEYPTTFSAPRPSPITKRSAMSVSMFGANAEASDARPNSVRLT